jgi:hypothetical protein
LRRPTSAVAVIPTAASATTIHGDLVTPTAPTALRMRALLAAAWIVFTHRARQRGQAFLERVRIGREKAAVDFRGAVSHIADPDLPVGLTLLAPPHRIGVGLGHDLVDLTG